MSGTMKADADAAESMQDAGAQPVAALKDNDLAALNGGSVFGDFMNVVHVVTDPIGAAAQGVYQATGGTNQYVNDALGAAGEVADHS